MGLFIYGTINENILTSLLDQLSHIHELYLAGKFSYINLDNLVNLKKLSLIGVLEESFNFELFKNLCNHLEDLNIRFYDFEEKIFVKLFKNESVNRFPSLRRLTISECKIRVIERDWFSNLQELLFLDLSGNRIERIEENAFSNLKKLETIDLSGNNLTHIHPGFIGLIESAEYSIWAKLF